MNVAIVYDAQTNAIVQVVIPATAAPTMYVNERCVMVPLGFYRQFTSQEDLIAAIPHLAPSLDVK